MTADTSTSKKTALKVVIATRESRLAMWQAEHVQALLQTRDILRPARLDRRQQQGSS